MAEDVATSVFSNLYTELANVSGLPRAQCKLAFLKMIYKMHPDRNTDWEIIREALYKRSREENPND